MNLLFSSYPLSKMIFCMSYDVLLCYYDFFLQINVFSLGLETRFFKEIYCQSSFTAERDSKARSLMSYESFFGRLFSIKDHDGQTSLSIEA